MGGGSWTIYSIGDSAYLETILVSLAAIGGTDSYDRLASIGFLIGVMMVSIRSILQGAKSIDYQEALVAVIIYSSLFGVKARAIIEDSYTGDVRVVDDLPFGPVAIGSLISRLGYNITVVMEQGFSTPSMTEYGFAFPLATLDSVRRHSVSSMSLGTSNQPVVGADAQQSFVNYLTDCTLTGVRLGAKTMSSILANPDPVAGITFNSDIYGTMLKLDGNTTYPTCTEASQVLSNDFLYNKFLPSFEANLQGPLKELTAVGVEDKVQTAVDILAGGSVDAKKYMVMNALFSFLEKSVTKEYRDSLDFSQATALETAIQQRNTQWAAEASMFQEIVRPLMTFFEGLVYAITPFMAFVIMLGSFGLGLLFKYFLMLLWIQLWIPILSIINLFIIRAASGEIAALQYASIDVPSMFSIYRMDAILQNYLGVAGMLAAATPALSMMLTSGAAVAMNSINNRIKGNDHFNEKISTPDVTSAAPALQNNALFSHDEMVGTVRSGSPKYAAQLDLSKSQTFSASSANAETAAISSSFSNALSSASSSAFSGGIGTTHAAQIASSFSSGMSYTHGAVQSAAMKAGIGSGWSQTQSGRVDMAATMVATAGGNFNYSKDGKKSANPFFDLANDALNGGGSDPVSSENVTGAKNRSGANLLVAAGLSGGIRNDRGNSQSVQELADFLQNISSDKSLRSDIQNSLRKDFSDGKSSRFEQTVQDSSSENLSQMATESFQKSKSFNALDQVQQAFGGRVNLDSMFVGEQIANSNMNYQPQVADLFRTVPGLRSAVQAVPTYRNMADKNVGTLAALSEIAYTGYGDNLSKTNPEGFNSVQETMDKMLMDYANLVLPNNEAPYKNQGVSAPVKSVEDSNLAQRVSEKTEGIRSSLHRQGAGQMEDIVNTDLINTESVFPEEENARREMRDPANSTWANPIDFAKTSAESSHVNDFYGQSKQDISSAVGSVLDKKLAQQANSDNLAGNILNKTGRIIQSVAESDKNNVSSVANQAYDDYIEKTGYDPQDKGPLKTIADDTSASIASAKALFQSANHPNPIQNAVDTYNHVYEEMGKDQSFASDLDRRASALFVAGQALGYGDVYKQALTRISEQEYSDSLEHANQMGLSPAESEIYALQKAKNISNPELENFALGVTGGVAVTSLATKGKSGLGLLSLGGALGGAIVSDILEQENSSQFDSRFELAEQALEKETSESPFFDSNNYKSNSKNISTIIKRAADGNFGSDDEKNVLATILSMHSMDQKFSDTSTQASPGQTTIDNSTQLNDVSVLQIGDPEPSLSKERPEFRPLSDLDN